MFLIKLWRLLDRIDIKPKYFKSWGFTKRSWWGWWRRTRYGSVDWCCFSARIFGFLCIHWHEGYIKGMEKEMGFPIYMTRLRTTYINSRWFHFDFKIPFVKYYSM